MSLDHYYAHNEYCICINVTPQINLWSHFKKNWPGNITRLKRSYKLRDTHNNYEGNPITDRMHMLSGVNEVIKKS